MRVWDNYSIKNKKAESERNSQLDYTKFKQKRGASSNIRFRNKNLFSSSNAYGEKDTVKRVK